MALSAVCSFYLKSQHRHITILNNFLMHFTGEIPSWCNRAVLVWLDHSVPTFLKYHPSPASNYALGKKIPLREKEPRDSQTPAPTLKAIIQTIDGNHLGRTQKEKVSKIRRTPHPQILDQARRQLAPYRRALRPCCGESGA